MESGVRVLRELTAADKLSLSGDVMSALLEYVTTATCVLGIVLEKRWVITDTKAANLGMALEFSELETSSRNVRARLSQAKQC